MILGHRHSVPIRLTLDTNHLGGRWPLFLADHRITEVYGHNHYDRLVEVKNKYDPNNFFRVNQNIEPAV